MHLSVGEQKADRRRGKLWIRVLGAEKHPHKITLGGRNRHQIGLDYWNQGVGSGVRTVGLMLIPVVVFEFILFFLIALHAD